MTAGDLALHGEAERVETRHCRDRVRRGRHHRLGSERLAHLAGEFIGAAAVTADERHGEPAALVHAHDPGSDVLSPSSGAISRTAPVARKHTNWSHSAKARRTASPTDPSYTRVRVGQAAASRSRAAAPPWRKSGRSLELLQDAQKLRTPTAEERGWWPRAG